jgi:hypothetical protein
LERELCRTQLIVLAISYIAVGIFASRIIFDLLTILKNNFILKFNELMAMVSRTNIGEATRKLGQYLKEKINLRFRWQKIQEGTTNLLKRISRDYRKKHLTGVVDYKKKK